MNGGVETPLDGPKDLDRRLNESRRAPRTTAPISTLTDGVFIMLGDNEYRLIWNGALHRWTPAGYVDPIPTADAGTEAVVVVTPSLSVAALRHGYPVEVHSSAAPDENATPRDLMSTDVEDSCRRQARCKQTGKTCTTRFTAMVLRSFW